MKGLNWMDVDGNDITKNVSCLRHLGIGLILCGYQSCMPNGIVNHVVMQDW